MLPCPCNKPSPQRQRAQGHQLCEHAHPQSRSVTSYEPPALFPREASDENHKPQSTGLLPPPSEEPSLTDYLMRPRVRLRVFHKHAPKHRGCSRNRNGGKFTSSLHGLQNSSTQREWRGFPALETGLRERFKGNLLHKELHQATSTAEENSPSLARTLQSGLGVTSPPHYGSQFQPSISPRD